MIFNSFKNDKRFNFLFLRFLKSVIKITNTIPQKKDYEQGVINARRKLF